MPHFPRKKYFLTRFLELWLCRFDSLENIDGNISLMAILLIDEVEQNGVNASLHD